MYNPIPNHAFLHSCYISDKATSDGSDALIACVKDMDTGESRLQIVENPKTQVFVLKEPLRNFEFAREYVRLSDCDMYIVPYKNQYQELYNIMFPRRRDVPLWQAKQYIQKSPFTFGWNISPQVRQKCEYLETMPKPPINLRIGVADIETSVLDDGTRDSIIALSLCDWSERIVHCFIDTGTWLRDMDVNALNKRTEEAYAIFEDGLNKKARAIWDVKPVKVNYCFCNGEKDLLVKAFTCLHQIKPDFLGIWNLGFDCPRIIDRLRFRQLDVNNLMCHPDVPEKYRYVEWHEDKSKVEHYTEVWHVLTAPGYTYWYDAMALYSRLRKVKGKEESYRLDDIGNKEIGSGKMSFGTNQAHFLMQTNDKIGYCVYNTIDTIIPALMNDVTQDVSSMLALSENSLIQDYSMQTVRLTSKFYDYLKAEGKIPGACAGSIKQEIDNAIGNIGGAVLDPTLMYEGGMKSVQGYNHSTSEYKLASDLDVSSFYPSMLIASNMSRETKEYTTVWVEGCHYSIEEILKEENPKKQSEMAKKNAEYIYALYGLLSFPKENAVHICNKYFGLPNYDEMLELITKGEINA